MHRHASLNRIYRLVWSHVHRTWVVVSETARGRGKRSSRKLLLATATLAVANLAQAGPVGGQVMAGTGSVQQSGNVTTVTQSTQHLALTWQSFDTNASESVNFVQPSTGSIAVNRVLDTNPTQFLGKLNANGQVYLINPNGVLFGEGAQVNVGGLVASTLDVADGALNGAARQFSGAGTGAIVNRGSITAAPGGYVAFVGNTVSNRGTITAPAGTVALGAGSDVTLSFAGNSLVNMQVDRSTLDNLAENGGLIRANAGTVIMTAGARDAVLASVVNNTGVVEAHSVRDVGGTIVLGGGAQTTTTNSGTLDASGTDAGAHGGTVKVLGDTVGLAAGSRIDVSGDAGGGLALVGGNFLGSGPERNAQNTTVAAGTHVDADAIRSGTGGQVAVWSDGTTQFHGAISARGGQAGGDGGHVETSGGTLKVGSDASVNTLAPHGAAGDWLLDPQDLTIGGFNPGDGDIDGGNVTAALQTSNVTIKTSAAGVSCVGAFSCSSGHAGNGDIILADGALIGGPGWTSGTTLTLSAYRTIYLHAGAGIDASSGTGSIVLRADNAGTGVGTVLFDSYSNVYGNPYGTLKIYYNPASYASPTNYAALNDGFGDPIIIGANLSTYMLVNVLGNVASKTYDRTTTATISGLSTLNSLPAGITFDVSGATATFADKNAGTNKAVTISGVTLSGTNAGSYYLNALDTKTATISKANLAVSGVSAANKTYDGTTAATLTGTAAVSAISGDVVALGGTGTGTFADKNVGTGKAVTVSGYTLAGADAGNYTIVQPTGLTANVGKANLTVTGVTAANKTYDGTTAATLNGTAAVTALGSDVVSLGGTATATFADKNAGAGKAVTVAGYSLGGLDAGNYNLVQPAGLTAAINKANLAVSGISAANKTYDGTTAATLTGTATVAAIGGDVVSVSGTGTGTFAIKNVGTGKAVTVSGYSLSGADAGNYNVVQPGGLTADVTKANLAITGVTAANKTYDGTAAATLSGTATISPFGGDFVMLMTPGTGTFVDKNAGTGKAVTVFGYSVFGFDAGNYNLIQPTGLTANIAKANLAITGVTAANKTYDGTTAATLNGTATVSAIGSDVVSVGGTGSATFADKNAGTGKAVTVSGYTLGGSDAGNYNVVQPGGLTASITKADLAITGVTAANKTYDGTTAATLNGTATVAALGADVVSVNGTGTATFADKNAGTNKAVAVSGYSLAGTDAGNYNVIQPSGLTAEIAKANLALSGLSVAGKTYDGTTAATLSGTATVSAIGGDAVSLSGTGSAAFVDKNAGTNKAVTVSGYTLSGLDAGNYRLVAPASLTADIAKADLAISGVTAANKTYDGTTAATLNGTAAVSALGGDVVSVNGTGSATFADKNAGTGKAVTVSGYTLGGSDAGNYNVIQPTGLTASIAKANLAVTGVTAANKTYDGTTAATLNGTATVAALGADVVSVNGTGTATFADKNAGTNKAVAVSGYTLGGADAGNYSIVQPTGLTAEIAKADLALSGLSVAGKTYDGATAAALSGTATVSAIGGDAVSLSGTGSAAFVDKNAGANKAVTVSGYTLSGLDAGNYRLVAPAGLTASIGKANVTVSGVTAASKTYDGTAAATLNGTAAVSALGGDVVSVSGTGTATFADKNAGANKAVTVSGYALGGADAGNYNVVQPSGLTASIAKANLAVSGVTAANKTYDSSTAATLNGAATVSAIGSDVVAVNGNGTAAFLDKNAGTNKAVTVSGYTLGGADAGNYNVVQPTGLTADIAKANVTVSGVTAANKVYDGTTAATLNGTAIVSAIGSDAVSASGGTAAFADKNAAANKAVTVSGYTLGGADAANYNVIQPSGLTAEISKANATVTGVTAANKVYDGTKAATLNGTATVSAIAGDAVSLGGGTAAFADKNAGTGKAVDVSGYRLAGADAGNYNLVQPTGLSADITPARLSVSGIVAGDKVFDGSTAATVSTAGALLGGKVGTDDVTLSSTGAFGDAAVGTGKTVNLHNTFGGADAGNYAIVDQATALASITPAGLPPTVRDVVTQVQSTVLPPQASTQPGALNLSSTVSVSASGAGQDQDGTRDAGDKDKARGGTLNRSINTVIGAGPSAPSLHIQNGGLQLPPLATTLTE
ncbi:filamentous hemagglutinin N-terminal domain-containing protein [Massilia sp. TW-1]|uniref:Filamentous hemagglutinin N-terminal domain-containing protein n=1 Tax=Telluria antibiotica TaxID=2717319 RepID=A0ABX0PA46_9BURK|nr:YDG domain-containing protein [Telluria antibiotica]NIA53508.1 filamentous hemagglutinin N-terminal domain-containing protein [Telluria antibiotica]